MYEMHRISSHSKLMLNKIYAAPVYQIIQGYRDVLYCFQKSKRERFKTFTRDGLIWVEELV